MNILSTKKILCLGSGIGTMNLLQGLHKYTKDLTIIATTSDDGGSAGRLRRLFNTLPPGDIISCIAAMSEEKNPDLAKLLLYRFPGDRYGADNEIGGQKLGNLLLVAAHKITGDYHAAVALVQKIVDSDGKIYPATEEMITLSARTKDGHVVHSEESIDLGKYDHPTKIENIFITPENPHVSDIVLSAIADADIITVGPGDLYTTTLPVLIIPAIKQALLTAKAEKIFVVNVANKPQETEGYTAHDFIAAVKSHVGAFPFQYVIVNNDMRYVLDKEHEKYTFVLRKNHDTNETFTWLEADVVNKDFPIYHDCDKLASTIAKIYNT